MAPPGSSPTVPPAPARGVTARGGLVVVLASVLGGFLLALVVQPYHSDFGGGDPENYLFNGVRHPGSRLVIVEGGSHFSPLRLDGQGEALFRLGNQLVGVEPRRVQDLLLLTTIEFLESGHHPGLLSPQRRVHDGVTAYVLDRAQAQRWRSSIP